MKQYTRLVLIIIFVLLPALSFSQGAQFDTNDDDNTVCTEESIDITNQSDSSYTYDWHFCYPDISGQPTPTAFSDSSVLSGPAFMSMARDSTGYHLFVTNHQDTTITKLAFNNDLSASPVSDTSIEDSAFPGDLQGISIQKDGINYYGFVVGGKNTGHLLRLDFGTSLSNTPAVNDLGFDSLLTSPQDIELMQDTSGNWSAFVASASRDSIVRFDFGPSLSNNSPAASDLQISSLSYPAGIEVIRDSINYFLFITNYNGKFITRAALGDDPKNDIQSSSSFTDRMLQTPHDITIVKNCRNYTGFVVNRMEDNIMRLNFNNGLTSPPEFTDMGSQDVLYHPQGLTEVIDADNDRFLFISNFASDSIARFQYPGCESAYETSNDNQLITSTDVNPPAYYYDEPGTFNIMLQTDKGLPKESKTCQQMEVQGGALNIGNDTSMCPGETTTLSLDENMYENPTWQDDSEEFTYLVDEPAQYWVNAVSIPAECDASDTVTVDYYEDDLYLGNDTAIQQGRTITLDAGTGYTSYTWFNGDSVPSVEVNEPGNYYVEVTTPETCTLRDSIEVESLEVPIPNVFTPNGDGINDTWDLNTLSVYSDIEVTIYNRYGKLLTRFKPENNAWAWDGKVNGDKLPPDTYWYQIEYNNALKPKNGFVTIKY